MVPAAAGTNTTTAIGLVYAVGLDDSQLQLSTTPADATTILIWDWRRFAALGLFELPWLNVAWVSLADGIGRRRRKRREEQPMATRAGNRRIPRPSIGCIVADGEAGPRLEAAERLAGIADE